MQGEEKNLSEELDNVSNSIEELKNKEFRLFGFKVTVISIGAALSILSAGIGSLYGAFVVYQDYMAMKERIDSYVAPDLSEFDKRLAVIEENSMQTTDYTRDIKNDLKSDIRRNESLTETIERSVKQSLRETEVEIRELRKNVRDDLDKVRIDMDRLKRENDSKIEKLKEDTEKRIQRAIDNPLSK